VTHTERRRADLRRKLLELHEMIRRSCALIRRSRNTRSRRDRHHAAEPGLTDEIAGAARATRAAFHAKPLAPARDRATMLEPATRSPAIEAPDGGEPVTRSPSERWQLAHQVAAALREAGVECEVVDPEPPRCIH